MALKSSRRENPFQPRVHADKKPRTRRRRYSFETLASKRVSGCAACEMVRLFSSELLSQMRHKRRLPRPRQSRQKRRKHKDFLGPCSLNLLPHFPTTGVSVPLMATTDASMEPCFFGDPVGSGVTVTNAFARKLVFTPLRRSANDQLYLDGGDFFASIGVVYFKNP